MSSSLPPSKEEGGGGGGDNVVRVVSTSKVMSGRYSVNEQGGGQPETTTIETTSDGDDDDDLLLDESERKSLLDERFWREKKKFKLPAKFRLVTEENALRWSLWTLRFSILVSAINTKLLNPNYAIMASPGAHEDSFPDTDPFDFNSATYFIPMMSLLGVAISSVLIGNLSDRAGRKSVILVLSVISGAGSIAKYFTRHSFWAFCITQLVFGFFLGNLPVGMAYIGDVFSDNKTEKTNELGNLVGCFVLGNSGGGMIAILMEDSGLFSALWVGAGLSFVSAAVTAAYLIEPCNLQHLPMGKQLLMEEEYEDEEVRGGGGRPATIDQCCMWNIVGGALADNFGSTGLFPLCLSPLALETFYLNFVTADPPQEPIMSLNGYKWLSVCVALMVVPSTIVTPHIFDRIGVAGTCVVGNVMTGIVTLGLLIIGNLPPTTATFAGFVVLLYGGFPVTVWSQLTTGPMLDLIAPEEKIGFVQGLNNSAMNFGMAFAPWILGILADATSTNIAIWTGIAISWGAGAINVPLMCRPNFGRPAPPAPHPSKRPLPGEDKEFMEKVLRGSYVQPDALYEVNRQRVRRRRPLLIPRVKPYDEEDLVQLRREAESNFRWRMQNHDRILAELEDPNREKNLDELCELLNSAYRRSESGDADLHEEAERDLGKWISDYLRAVGYHPHLNSVMVKQMILVAFPTIMTDAEFTPENIVPGLIRSRQVMNEYLDIHEKKKYTLTQVFGNAAGQRFFS